MKILLLGANGQVGHALASRLPGIAETILAARNGELDGVACESADFDQPESVISLVDRIAPDVVVNAAAYTAVDRAEQEVDAAFRVNAAVPHLLAEKCAATDALLVHYSTDYVFDGGADIPYREDASTAPLGVYGASKFAGEQAIRASRCRHMILRTAWVYGNHGANFMRTMLRLAAEREEVRVVADQFGTPTPADLIARVTVHLLQQNFPDSGTWHLTATGKTSWQGFAQEIFTQAASRGMALKTTTAIPITTADYPTPAKRPAYSCLDTSKLRNDFGIRLPDWQEALAEVLDAAAV